MAEISERTFQQTVSEYLIRHRSILDVESKFWWAFAISATVFVVGLMMWAIYVYRTDFQ